MKKIALNIALHLVGIYLALWVIPAVLITWHNEQLSQLLTILMKRIKEFEKHS